MKRSAAAGHLVRKLRKKRSEGLGEIASGEFHDPGKRIRFK
jgi:hypothetical protein